MVLVPALGWRGHRGRLALGAGLLALVTACRPLRHPPGGTNSPGGAGGGGGGGGGGGAGVTVEGDCTPLPPLARRLWRLSLPQYAHSVRDLLGTATEPLIDGATSGAPPDAFLVDDSLSVGPFLAQRLATVNHDFLTGAADRVAALAACASGEGEEACATRFARGFGARAFRRPLADEELSDLLAVYADGRQQDFPTGVSTMIEALLLSPSFMFRTELGAGAGNPTTLTAYEIAGQLSFTLTDSTPDAALLDDAGSGRLATSEGIAAAADRLLALPATRPNLDRVTAAWFGAPQIFTESKDPALLAALGGAGADQLLVQNHLYQSLTGFIDDALWRPQALVTDLLTSSRVLVDQQLATLVGLPFPAAASQPWVLVDAGSLGRAGIPTQPAFLWAHTPGGVSATVRRGLALRDQVACAEASLPEPPRIHEDPAVRAALAALPGERARSDYALATEPCRSCHVQIDPFGRILDGFDAVGHARATADGLAVDPTGDFSATPPLTGAGTITGAAAFAQAMVADGRFTRCATQKLASYTLGRAIQGTASCELQRLNLRVAAGDGSLRALAREVVSAPFARTRTQGAAP